MRGNFIFQLVKFDQSGLSEEFVKILILDIQGYPQRMRLLKTTFQIKSSVLNEVLLNG